jgi:nitric oxide reductase subunit B
MKYLRLWIAPRLVIAPSFAVLGYYGWELYRQAPPVPERVVTADGAVVFTGQQIRDGQNVWQSMGGQEVGTVWGHGSYVAPDWSADWLHCEASWLADRWAEDEYGRPFEDLDDERQAALKARLRRELRTNTYAPETGDLEVSPLRAEAIAAVGGHYAALFGDDPAFDELRDAYAILANSIRTPERRELLNACFSWAAWACATDRPGGEVTYTNNWPAESLIDNRPTRALVVWSVLSFVLLLAGIGALAWYFAIERHKGDDHHEPPEADPLLALRPTPSMRATLK